MDWFIKAANNGNAKPMNRIGWMYQYGMGVTKNIPTAIEWYTKAANHGNPSAQYWLGYIYKNEDQIKDLQLAVNWYQKAADKGSKDSKEEVNKLNKQGYYVI
jgi:TPR repeat protein